MRSRTVEVTWQHADCDYVVTCVVSGGSPGQLYGPPERCYPPEDPEVEVIDVVDDLPDGTATRRPDLIEVAASDLTLADAAIEQACDEERDARADAAEWRREEDRDARYLDDVVRGRAL